MFGNDPKKIEQMMKKLNINTREVRASQVIIKTAEGDLLIDNPDVMIMNMMGRDVFQITGHVRQGSAFEERPVPKKEAPREEDIKLVMDQTGHDRDTVAQKLEELNNDLARTIVELKKK